METIVNRKKLLVTASTFPRWEGDTEPRFILDLCSHMTDEFDVTVLVPAASGAKDRECMEGVNVIRYHYFPIHKWETLCYPGAIVPRIKEKKIRALLVPFLFAALWLNLFRLLPKYDVVHAHWLIPQGIVQSFFKKLYIVTGHGGDVTSLNQGVIKKLKVRCLKRASGVTVVSEHLKNKVKELVPELEPDVISMGVDTKKFGRQYYQPDYFGQGDKKVVLFVGRLAEKKGVTYLIEAMKSIDAMLVVVGDGPLRNRLEEQAKAVNDSMDTVKIVFWGAKAHAELRDIYESADVFVMPSVTAEDGDQEGLGLVMLEAMASGLPVVASRSGGIIEIIDHMQNGILVEERDSEAIANAVNRLLMDELLRNTITKHGYKKVAEYDYKVLADKYIERLSMLQRKIPEGGGIECNYYLCLNVTKDSFIKLQNVA